MLSRGLSYFIVALFLFHYSPQLISQRINLGAPFVENYSKDLYDAGIHTWNIISANNRIYFANDNGLLEYNGHQWNLFQLPKKTILRSLDSDSAGRIFVGGQDEIGFFFPDDKGILQFSSIRYRIPEQFRSFEDVWDLIVVNDDVYARSIDRIYIFRDTLVEVMDPHKEITFMSKVGETVYYNLKDEGIYKRSDGNTEFVKYSDQFAGVTIIDVFEFNEDILVFTENEGVFIQNENGFSKWNDQLHDFIIDRGILSVGSVSETQIAIGTISEGLVVLDLKGTPIYYLRKDSGLQSNNIASIHADLKGNVWVGTFNGIDKVLLNDEKQVIYPDGELEGAVYDIAIHNDQIFFGTNNGLYYCDWNTYYNPIEKNRFQFVENSEGQVWGLDTLNGELFMGHNRGAFQIQNGFAQQVSEDPGYWKFLSFHGGNKLIAGNYRGISLFDYKNGNWVHKKDFVGFEESARFLIKESEQRIWVSHPYRGVFRIDLSWSDEEIQVKKYADQEGLPSILRNHVFKIGDDIIVTGETGIYQYDTKSDRFELYSGFTKLFDANTNIKRLFEDSQQNIWYITDTEAGNLKTNDDLVSRQILKNPLLGIVDKFVPGYENIHVFDQNNLFIPGTKGAIHYTIFEDLEMNKFNAGISSVSLISDRDSLIFGGNFIEGSQISLNQSEEFIPEFKHNENSIRFNFYTSPIQDQAGIEYNSFIEGVDVSAGYWSAANYKQYTSLPSGDYILNLKSKNENGVESEAITYSFKILPAWYETRTALLIYSIIALLILGGMILIPRSRYKKKTKVLQDAAEKSEEEIVQLKNEKLEADIQFKNQQLASSTMHIVQKNEVIHKVKEEIEQMKKRIKDPNLNREIKKLISVLSDDERLDDDWEKFAYHFDQVHTDFLRRIKEEYPNLSPKDQKLCAYLRMNLSTKEIAPLMNISIRGVEISRYRLRKKLSLVSDVNLNEFMMEY